MKKRILLIATAICASSGAMAADVSQTINPLAEATRIMDRCAGIAAKISSTPVPAGHNEAVAAAFHNEAMAKSAEHGKAVAPGQLKAVAPEQKAFFAMIRTERDALQKCGEDYQKVHKAAEALSDKAGAALEKAKTPTEDDKKVGAAVMAYEKSSEHMAGAITALSKDVNYERYVGAVVNKYFLAQDKK